MKYLREFIDFNDIDDIGDYSEFEGHEDFKKFLDDNNVLDDFIYQFNNVDRYWRGIRISGNNNRDDLKYYLDNMDRSYYIANAFSWDESGDDDLWYKLNDKWRELLKNR